MLGKMYAHGRRNVSHPMILDIDVGGHQIMRAYKLEAIKDDSVGLVISLYVIGHMLS